MYLSTFPKSNQRKKPMCSHGGFEKLRLRQAGDRTVVGLGASGSDVSCMQQTPRLTVFAEGIATGKAGAGASGENAASLAGNVYFSRIQADNLN
jgi:hypothetical protein